MLSLEFHKSNTRLHRFAQVQQNYQTMMTEVRIDKMLTVTDSGKFQVSQVYFHTVIKWMKTNLDGFYQFLISVSLFATNLSCHFRPCHSLISMSPDLHLPKNLPHTHLSSLPDCFSVQPFCFHPVTNFVLHFRHSKLSFSSTCLPLNCALESIAFTKPNQWKTIW